ncbi:hypothetical protein HK104_003400, partial [Borealophlyctis nickersoniae]
MTRSHSIPDTDHIERIAQLIRKHKEANVDKATGRHSIPARASSYISPRAAKIAVNGGVGGPSTDGGGDRGVVDKTENTQEGQREEKEDEDAESESGTESFGGATGSSVGGTMKSDRSALTGGDTYTLERGDTDNGKEDEGGDTDITPVPGSPVLTVGEDGGKVNGDSVADIGDAQGGNEELENGAGKEATPVSADSKAYKTMDPMTVARMLYDGTLGVGIDGVSPIIGKGDEYHNQVLAGYMDCFDFSGISLDDSFRSLTSHLYLTGETQMIDRILYQFSRRYWDCNLEMHSLFRSIDIVYGILFSLVLLNTDLHIANASAPSRKISKKVWVKNTMELVEKMIKDAEAGGEGEVVPLMGSGAPEDEKKWQKNVESVLKDLYQSIKDERFIQRSNGSTAATATESSGPAPTPPLQTDTVPPSPASYTSHISHRMRRDDSCLSVDSTMSTGTTFSTFSTATRGKTGGLFRKKDKSDVRSIFNGWSGGGTTPGSATSSASGYMTTPTLSPLTPGTSPDFDLLHPSSSLPPRDPRTSSSSSSAAPDILVEGLLIRKHLRADSDTKARNRRWVKVWCGLIAGEKGVELLCRKVEGLEGDFHTVVGGGVHESPAGEGMSAGVVGISGRRSTEGLRKLIKVSPHAADTLNLLHSHTHIIPPPGYSHQRPHVLRVRLSNNNTYLFHAPTAEACTAWARSITYWAARRSKEPLRGGVGSLEYGWGVVKSLPAKEHEREGRDAVELDAGSMKSATEGSEMGDDGMLDAAAMKKMKIVEWTPPGGLGMVVSGLSESDQLLSMRRQLSHVAADLASHDAVRAPMERFYANYPALKTKAMANWAKRREYLIEEWEKYRGYVAALEANMADEGGE